MSDLRVNQTNRPNDFVGLAPGFGFHCATAVAAEVKMDRVETLAGMRES
jgi:hypothetical protein